MALALFDNNRQIPDKLMKPGVEQSLVYSTPLGELYAGDCLDLFPFLPAETVDTIFADPPFNLAKKYGKAVNDSRTDDEYLIWCQQWLDECIRVLKPGGALFVYNLPKWNIHIGCHLSQEGMIFRHWIAVNIKLSLPIPGRLYPSHYSLLYYTKGKPQTFRKIRTPIEQCRHCSKEIKDYGGHRHAMNPNGVNLTDVWNDITPVRHWKFKDKNRRVNQLSTKLVARVIQLSTNKCDLVLDPFGGSGTTFDVCERLDRHWLGFEVISCETIIERLQNSRLHPHKSDDFVEED